MKTKFNLWKLSILLLSPLFINGICNKDDSELKNADQYVTWNIAGQSGGLASPNDSLDVYIGGNTTSIYGSTKPNPGTNFSVFFNSAQTPGIYTTTDCGIVTGSNEYYAGTTPLQINVTEYGGTGLYITGTYSGTLIKASNNSTVSVTGEFRLKNN